MPILTEVDLPMPPSVNRIWRASTIRRKRGVTRSPSYRAWIKEADAMAVAMGALKGRKMIRGRFDATITLPFDYMDDPSRDPPFDIDNRVKCALDWAQSRGLIFTDRRCMRVVVQWGNRWEAPTGCRLRLQEWKAPSAPEQARPAG